MIFGAGIVITLAASLKLVDAHARVTSPPIRSPGNAFLDACGQTSFASVSSDPTGHIEEQEPVTAGCQLDLCRGMLFSDQPASNIQQVTPGAAMSMQVDCTIPHGGPANVTLLDTTASGPGGVIGESLASFDDFCPTSGGTPANQSNIQFTLPNSTAVADKCQNAGDCVVQLFWATPDFSQNYFYCVDVAMGSNSSVVSNATGTAATATSSIVDSSGVHVVKNVTLIRRGGSHWSRRRGLPN